MTKLTVSLAGLLAAALSVSAAGAGAEPLKIGFMNSLTSPSGIGAQHARDGFNLALKKLGGKLGGTDTEVLFADDEGKPDVAVAKAKTLIERDKVSAIVGFTFSNVVLAALKPITQSKTFLISANPGPSPMAGKLCNPYSFVVSFQTDMNSAVSGQYAQAHGLKRMILLAPNYQGGKDAMVGFKERFKGEIIDEIYTPIGQPDYSAEISKIAAAKPDAIFVFLAGAPGIAFIKQFRQAGLADKMTFLSFATIDESTLPAQQEAAIGLYGGMNWAPNLDNAANKEFVRDFEATYRYVPSNFSAHAYDSVMLLDSAVRAVHGDISDKEAFRAALKKADFPSVRGQFRFGSNQIPVQNYYLTKAVKRPDGKFQTETVETTLPNAPDDFVDQCPIK